MEIKTGTTNPDHSTTTKDITILVITIYIEVALDHNTEIDAATIEVANNDLTQPTGDTATDLTMTHHTSYIADHPHITALWVINPEITVGHINNHLTDRQGMNHADQIHTPAG